MESDTQVIYHSPPVFAGSHVPSARKRNVSKSMLDLTGLNPPQREAVTTLSGPMLVLAGAGTGKTRVITFRMANLIRSGIQPDRILSVTFTNKAAREMRERALSLIGKRATRKPMVSTFHAYCVRVLREDINVLGYPKKFVIYDRGDQESGRSNLPVCPSASLQVCTE